MGRPPLEIGEHGRIRLRPMPAGSDGTTARWSAHTLYRDQSGRTKAIRRVGDTEESALEALKEAVEDKSQYFGRVFVNDVRVKVPRPRSESPVREHALYRFYGDGDSLLYVGITMSPLQRFRDHGAEKTWWGEVKCIRIEDHPSYESARAAERAAIQSEMPAYNIAG